MNGSSLAPNMRDVTARTWGIARTMWHDLPGVGDPASPDPLGLFGQAGGGGGNLNGSRNQAHLMGQAGTGCDRVSLPRKPNNPGNYCGVV